MPDIPPHAKEQLRDEHLNADQVMLILLLVQWFIATFITSLSYGTYLLGFIGGGLTVLVCYIGMKWFSGTKTMRALIATAMMLFSIIFIQQHFGRIEMHFHVFIAMALLAIYKEVFPILVAGFVSILHHLTFNFLQLYEFELLDTPIIIFNYGCGLDIVFLHGAFVIFEMLALAYIAKLQLSRTLQVIISEDKIKELNSSLEKENEHSKALAQQFAQFAHALDESAIVSKADPNGIITYVNKRFCEISGYNEAELIGHPHNIIRHSDMPQSFFEEMWQTISTKNIFKGIIKNRKKNGNEYYVESFIIPILDINENIQEYLAVRYDVTELIHSRDEALAAQKAKDQFLANMSHELRTPLNAIIGFTQIVRKKNENEALQHYLDITMESSNKLLHLINDILDLSKIQSGKFTLNPYPFRLEEELRLLMATFEKQAEEKGVVFSLHIAEEIHGRYFGDWGRTAQVISNFVSNAIKFTPAHGNVTIDATYSNGTFSLSVADTGIGMSEEAKNRIFNPFEQADSSTTRQFGGTGLGLSISKELVMMMSGRIEIESAEGEGSTFTLLLPLPVHQTTPSKQPERTAEVTETPQLAGHILVAEDNKSNQVLIRLLLEELGMSCDIANDGEEAVNMYDGNTYDLVLMDENMPKMTGTEAMQRIRESHAHVVPIIALTANVMHGDKEKFLATGMTDYLSKPIDDKALAAMMQKYLLKPAK